MSNAPAALKNAIALLSHTSRFICRRRLAAAFIILSIAAPVIFLGPASPASNAASVPSAPPLVSAAPEPFDVHTNSVFAGFGAGILSKASSLIGLLNFNARPAGLENAKISDTR